MKTIFLINAHQFHPFSEGKLNKTLSEKAKNLFQNKGYHVLETNMSQNYNIDEEINKHIQSDAILLQSPINWMGMPWSFKKYMDEVYTAGMNGTLCNGDGRSRENPLKQYGSGGTLTGKQYMISLTFNAPKEAFKDEKQFLFQGKSVDDLLFPMHMNFKFFGLELLPTFACFDVMKNPDIENDLIRFETHLTKHF